MISKRTFLTSVVALVLSTTLLTAPAFAIGGDDPISGIDIIVKEDPGSRPIKEFSMNGREIKQLNALKGKARPTFVIKTIAKRIKAGDAFVKSGVNALGKKWCGPCKMVDQLSIKFKDDKAGYKVNLSIDFGEVKASEMRRRKAKKLTILPDPK